MNEMSLFPENDHVFTFVEGLLILAFNFFESNFPAEHHINKQKEVFTTKRFSAFAEVAACSCRFLKCV